MNALLPLTGGLDTTQARCPTCSQHPCPAPLKRVTVATLLRTALYCDGLAHGDTGDRSKVRWTWHDRSTHSMILGIAARNS
ncbi:MAG: hypothetical protein KDC03_12615 [Flavobacteriales bacterium]|nr:hypothetical protein [Flavobacteriales bacterium]